MMYLAPSYITVYLYEKDPLTWDVISGPNAGVAMMKYMPENDEFYFQIMGRKLAPNTNYTLIYYPDPWPGNNLICLGAGTSTFEGKLRINGYDCPSSPYYSDPVSTGNMPASYDWNYGYGAKIWLVLSSDVQCGGATPHMTAWNPSDYLFENVLIQFVDSDG